jgi:hypothetical protein
MRHAAHVAHHLRGRLRIRIPSAKGDPVALERIRLSLESLAGIQSLQVNETLGSITIRYDPQQHADFESRLAGEGPHQEELSVSIR